MNTIPHYFKTICVFVALFSLVLLISLFLVIVTMISPIVEVFSHLFKLNVLFPDYDTTSQNLHKIEYEAIELLCKGKASFEVLRGHISIKVPVSCSESFSYFEEATGEMTDIVETCYHVVCISPLSKSKSSKSILFVHGVNSGPLFFRFNILPFIEEGYNVFLLSLPGFGMADIPSKVLSFTRSQLLYFYSEFLHQLLSNKLGSHRPVVVGHSFGGFLFSHFSAKYSDDIESLVLVNTSGIFPGLDIDGRYWAVLFKLGFPNRFARQVGRCLNVIFFHTVMSDSIVELKSLFWEFAQMSCSENFGDFICSKFISLDFFTAYWNRVVLHDLVTSQVKLAIIWGCDDNIIPAHAAKLLGDLAQVYGRDKVPIYYVKGGWHNPPRFSNGLQFNKALRHFLIGKDTMKDQKVKFKMMKHISIPYLEAVFKQYGGASFDMNITRSNIQQLYTHLLRIYSGVGSENPVYGIDKDDSLISVNKSLNIDNHFYVTDENGCIKHYCCVDYFKIKDMVLGDQTDITI